MINRLSRLLILIMFLTLFSAMSTYANDFDPTVCVDYVPGETELNEECQLMMETFPDPVVVEVGADYFTLGAYSYWRVGPHAVNLYSAPGGSIVGQMPEGFNFAVVTDASVTGWLQIQGGEWIQESDAEYFEASDFRGVLLLNGLEHPFAWILDTTGIFTSEYPGGPQSPENGRLTVRYDLVNIFAEAVDEDGWTWYMIGPDQWLEQRFMSVARRVERPEGVSGRWVAIDLYEQTLVGYEDDTPVFATLVATGLPDWETDEGIFNIWARLEQDGMSGATGAPDAYALQSVPWTMYFNGDISLHGTYWHNLFGYRHSHGCVNLSISDARHIFEWTGSAPSAEDGEIVTYVYVYSSGEYR